jgi:hypothetical protein
MPVLCRADLQPEQCHQQAITQIVTVPVSRSYRAQMGHLGPSS